MKIVTVKASKTYDVVISKNVLDKVGKTLKEKGISGKIAVITDKKVNSLYAEKVLNSLKKAGFETHIYVAPVGEKSKSGKVYLSVLEFLAKREFTRSDAILALGGGVIGDLTGFIAGTYLRGIKYVQVPTTLLAFADSSVGGKTAINLKSGKNLVGVFNQPELVLCDLDVLNTLSEGDYACGMAEIIKYGMIFDAELLNLLKGGMKDNAEEIVARCVSWKRTVVEKDEHDNGDRQLLNFGHTLAHSIEKQSKFKLLHGQAVAIGMKIITERAVKNGICNQNTLDVLIELLQQYNLPLTCGYSLQKLFDATLVDKKRKGDSITVVIPEQAGKCVLKKMSMAEWKEFIFN